MGHRSDERGPLAHRPRWACPGRPTPGTSGTALSAQTALGFALTVLSVQLVPLLAEAVGWQVAFLLLAPGPALERSPCALGSRG
jgi:hypothetical protein